MLEELDTSKGLVGSAVSQQPARDRLRTARRPFSSRPQESVGGRTVAKPLTIPKRWCVTPTF